MMMATQGWKERVFLELAGAQVKKRVANLVGMQNLSHRPIDR